ncbi:MAG: hypothetical protein V4530_12540 [Pseudomonadota bacterium]
MSHQNWTETMKPMISLLAIAVAGMSAPLMAQVDSQSNAINTARVATANADVAADAQQEAAMNAEQKEQYAKDMTAYREALRQHDRAKAMDERIYDRQQRAYARAMFDWRMQVAACKRGNNAACNAPTPDPANYWGG